MIASSIRRIVLPALIAALGLFAVGCYADVQPVAADGYEPSYYDGYVVYYDTGGRPYYYNGGRPYYVPASYPHYRRLTGHYTTYGPRYHNWYHRHGYRYRTYRSTRYRR